MLRFLRNLSILLISFILSLFLLEYSLSKLLPRFDPSSKFTYYINPNGVVLGPKNFRGHLVDNSDDFDVNIAINKYGFRDSKDLASSTYEDFFVVGDSFCFGYGIEEQERFSDLIQYRLKIPVFNISIPGNFNDYERFIQYAQGNGAQIKNIIIGVCMENDFADYSENIKNIEAYNISNKKKSMLAFIKNYLTLNSTTYNLIAWVGHNNNYLKLVFIRLGIIIDVEEGVNRSYLNKSILNSSALKLKQITNNFKAIILIIPSRGLWMGNNKDIESAVHNEFVRLVTNHGLDVIDMRPIFEASGAPLQYHFPNNGHWNSQGHAVAADAIIAYIKQARLTRHDF